MTQADLTQPAIDTTLRDTRPLARSRSAFYFGMAIAMSVTVFIGFGPSFYTNAYFAETLGLPPVQALSSIIIVHGLVFTTWMILLMVQTGLVAGGQVRWHRRLGIAGAVLTDLFLVALLVHDWRTVGRPHTATLCGSLVILAMQALNNSSFPHNPGVWQLMRWLAG